MLAYKARAVPTLPIVVYRSRPMSYFEPDLIWRIRSSLWPQQLCFEAQVLKELEGVFRLQAESNRILPKQGYGKETLTRAPLAESS